MYTEIPIEESFHRNGIAIFRLNSLSLAFLNLNSIFVKFSSFHSLNLYPSIIEPEKYERINKALKFVIKMIITLGFYD